MSDLAGSSKRAAFETGDVTERQIHSAGFSLPQFPGTAGAERCCILSGIRFRARYADAGATRTASDRIFGRKTP